MKKMTVGELSKLYGIHRQSIYKRINKGDLSKSADGKIDFAEAIRVFGEPDGRGEVVPTVQSTQVQMDTQVDKLQLQVEMLEKQLKKAEETEQFLKDQIKEKDTSIHLLQTLLSAPKPKDLGVKQEDATQEIAPQVINEPQPIETAVYSGKEQTDTELKSRKKGLLGRVINAVFDG
jgi:hypothetical protein